MDPTEASCAKVEEIVWARLPIYQAGPYAWLRWATLSRYLDSTTPSSGDYSATCAGKLETEERAITFADKVKTDLRISSGLSRRPPLAEI